MASNPTTVRYRAQPLDPTQDVEPAHKRTHYHSYNRAADAAGKEAILWAMESRDPEAVVFRVVRISSIPMVEAKGTDVGPVETRTISTPAALGGDIGEVAHAYAVRYHFGPLSKVVGAFGDSVEAWDFLTDQMQPGHRLSLEHQIHENVADISPVYFPATGDIHPDRHHEVYDGGMHQESTVSVLG
jgi:hypothetical protein